MPASEHCCWDDKDLRQGSKRGCRAGRGTREGGLTALIIEVVHGALGGVVEGAGLVHVGASPGEQQGGGEVQGRGQRQRPGVGGSAAALRLLQAAGEGRPGSAPRGAGSPHSPQTGGRCSPGGRAHDRRRRSGVAARVVAPPDGLGPPHTAGAVSLARFLGHCPEKDPRV